MIIRLSFFACLLFSACSNPSEPSSIEEKVHWVDSLKATVRSNPDSFLLIETYIQALRDSNQYDEAIAEANLVLNRLKGPARFYQIRAVLEFEQADTLSAIQSLDSATKLEPLPEYRYALATLYAHTGQSQALVLADSLEAFPQKKWEKEAWLIRGQYFVRKAETQKALEQFDLCIREYISFTEAYREKAILLMNLQKPEEALATLDKAVTLKNNFEEGHYYRGVALEMLNRNAQAMEAYQKALLYDPEYLEAEEAIEALKKGSGKKKHTGIYLR